MSKDDTRYARNECLICGDPLMRLDDIPCCSGCWDKVLRDVHNKNGRKKHMRWQMKGHYVKVLPDRNKVAL